MVLPHQPSLNPESPTPSAEASILPESELPFTSWKCFALVSFCCANKLPQFGHLSNTNVLLSYSSVGQKSDAALTGLKSRCQWGCVASGGSREEFVSLPFQLLDAAHIPWLVASSSTVIASNSRRNFSHAAIALILWLQLGKVLCF